VRGSTGESGLIALTGDPSHQAPPLCVFAGSSPVMHRRVPLARCSATGRSSPRGLAGRWVLPSCFAQRRSWGSTLRRFAPATGGCSSLSRRAHMPFGVRITRPIDFRRADFAARSEHESGQMSGKSGAISTFGFWAWLPSAVRFQSASFGSRFGSFLPWALPLAGLRTRRTCIRTGSTPPGSSASKSFFRPSIRSWV
jgi:hypothetical protein